MALSNQQTNLLGVTAHDSDPIATEAASASQGVVSSYRALTTITTSRSIPMDGPTSLVSSDAAGEKISRGRHGRDGTVTSGGPPPEDKSTASAEILGDGLKSRLDSTHASERIASTPASVLRGSPPRDGPSSPSSPTGLRSDPPREVISTAQPIEAIRSSGVDGGREVDGNVAERTAESQGEPIALGEKANSGHDL